MSRVAFVTGCLEPGRDGVGDYTRDLAAAGIAAGHPAATIAVHDRFVTSVDECAQVARGVRVPTLRLPVSLPWAERIEHALAWHGLRDADWMSLQFVPYALHPKGVVAGLERHLARLAGRRLVHVMFHELWIGAERGASLRHRLVGGLQRVAALRLVRALAPQVVHTSNQAYVALLRREGVDALELPLCGSVPLARESGPDWLTAELVSQGTPLQFVRPRERTWWFGMFGSIHPQWSPEPLLSTIATAAHATGRRVTIVSAGRQGPGAPVWQGMLERYAGTFALRALGERPVSDLSRYLHALDFGIATTPWQLIGKSATVAAMLDHGLPVIVTRDDVHYGVDAGPTHPLLHRYCGGTESWLTAGVARGAARDGLSELARRFRADLAIGPGRDASRRMT